MGIVQNVEYLVMQCLFWISAAVFSAPYKKKDNFIRHGGIIGSVIIICECLFFQFFWNTGSAAEQFFRIGFFILMVVLIYSCWEMHLSAAIYNTVWALSVWQLLLESWIIIKLLGRLYFDQYPWALVLGALLFFAISYYICTKTIAAWMANERKPRIGPRQLTSAILIFGIIEVLALSRNMYQVEEYNGDWKFIYVTQLLGVIILYLQNELFKKVQMRQEMALMNLLWKKEQEQYQLARENINLINQKCHDLKHQIRALRKVSKEEFDRYLNGVEEAVEIYESIVKTGNDVFDTILTEKSLYCRDRKIQVSCVADGSQMDFIDAIDLYAILGNAMDNAIEAVEKFKEPEKRQIDVMIYRQQNFLVMNFINPIPGELIFEDEFPVSTKGDKRFHGYGLRSIKHFVKKYEGFLNVSIEDGCFSLKMMIPIPNK